MESCEDVSVLMLHLWNIYHFPILFNLLSALVLHIFPISIFKDQSFRYMIAVQAYNLCALDGYGTHALHDSSVLMRKKYRFNSLCSVVSSGRQFSSVIYLYCIWCVAGQMMYGFYFYYHTTLCKYIETSVCCEWNQLQPQPLCFKIICNKIYMKGKKC